jgi:tRNA-specific 2-thiouridylase
MSIARKGIKLEKQKNPNANKTVYVAMSGGVDSSVAAALLKREGYNVVGVFMKQWQPSLGDFCIWKEERDEAIRAATHLGINFKTWDFTKEYKKLVADYMIKEYKAGRTPNPDVMCNKEIKFGLFFKKAIKEGADFVATGHYIIREGNKLLQGIDKNKDQSYFLWTLKEKQLEKCLFPIGKYTKPEIRKLAKKFRLPNAEKKDSQGVCFIGPLDVKDFLIKRIKSKKGKIIKNGQVVGFHDGVFYYTIGQRHGLDIKSGAGPFYVINKDTRKNIIYVGDEKDLEGQEAKVTDFNWINETLKLPAKVDVKIRYRTLSTKAILHKNGTLKFLKPVRAITPGQSAVFYRSERMLGGGIIE